VASCCEHGSQTADFKKGEGHCIVNKTLAATEIAYSQVTGHVIQISVYSEYLL
jgi:hypothetical protein